jgi:hypothetical protein
MRLCDELRASIDDLRANRSNTSAVEVAHDLVGARSLFVFGVRGRPQIRCETLRFSEMRVGFRARATLL